MLNRFYILLTGIILLSACQQKPPAVSKEVVSERQKTTIEQLIDNLKNPNDNLVIVVAHRGDWRNAPENSLRSIQNCIDIGVDMVEIDVRMTKDSVLVLMHDQTIDRTTTGTGMVKDITYNSLQTLFLRDGIGHPTFHKVPTLEEALLTAKDKILINLDKSYDIFDRCFEIAKKTGTLDQLVIKGAKTRNEVEREFGHYLNEVFFMPIVRLTKPNAEKVIDDYLDHRVPIAFEFIVRHDTISLIGEFKNIRKKGASVWVNSLWPELSGGHDDERAAIDPSVYDWYIQNNIDIIQTDRPQLLINYLQAKGLHN